MNGSVSLFPYGIFPGKPCKRQLQRACPAKGSPFLCCPGQENRKDEPTPLSLLHSTCRRHPLFPAIRKMQTQRL